MIPKSHTAVFQALAAVVEHLNRGREPADADYLPFAFNDVEIATVGYGGQAEICFRSEDSKQNDRKAPKDHICARLCLRYMRTPKVWVCEKVEVNNRYFILTWDGADIAAIEEIFRPENAMDIPEWYGKNWF